MRIYDTILTVVRREGTFSQMCLLKGYPGQVPVPVEGGGGYPHPSQWQGHTPSFSMAGGGTPSFLTGGVPSSLMGGGTSIFPNREYPHPVPKGGGYPSRMGYLPARTGWGYPPPGNSYAWTRYGAVSTPLAVSHRRIFLLQHKIEMT